MTSPPPPKYPKPDRSDQVRKLTKDEHGVIDIGWCDGVISDGRPFVAEMWAQDGISMLTIFFSSEGIDHLTSDQLKDLVAKEGLVTFRAENESYCEAAEHEDRVGNAMWSINIVVGSEDETFLTGSVPIFAYSQSSSGY
jgi:hypothetical protein